MELRRSPKRVRATHHQQTVEILTDSKTGVTNRAVTTRVMTAFEAAKIAKLRCHNSGFHSVA